MSTPSSTSPLSTSPSSPAPSLSHRSRWREARVWVARVALIALALGGAFGTLTPPGRAMTRASLLLPAVVFAATGQVNPLDAIGEGVRHTSLTLQDAAGPIFLDVFEPATPAPPLPGGRAAYILISGVGDNRGDAQLVNFEQSFARSGLVLMALTTPALLGYTLSVHDPAAVDLAFDTLARWPGVNPRAIGFIGLSAGGSALTLAAADAHLRDRVASLTLFGCFYDAADYLRDVGRRALLVSGRIEPWQPDIVPLQVLADSLTPTLPPSEGAIIQQSFSPAFAPLPASEVALFSSESRAVYHLLAGDEPGQVDANMAALSPAIISTLAALSPSGAVVQLRAPVYLMHDRHDPYVPFTESQDFARALSRLGHPYSFALFDIFQHVEVKGGLNPFTLAGDGARLWGVIDQALNAGA